MSPEEFLIQTYKQLDVMKAQIRARYHELNGCEPSAEELAYQLWDVWRLTTVYLDAVAAMNSDEGEPVHAPYLPPEVAGARSERMQAMDAKLQEVLGDTVEVEEDAEDDEDEASFDFCPSPDEQITMIEYGALIYEWSDFVDRMNPVQLAPGDRGMVMNIVQHWCGGFDELMGMLYDCLMERLRQAQ